MNIFNQIGTWIEQTQKETQIRREHRKAIEGLIENSQVTERFIVMSLLSGLVAMCGILLQDTSILIAAMVLAPLLNPLLSLGAGITLGHPKLIWFSLKAFAIGFSSVIGLVSIVSFGLNLLGAPMGIAAFSNRFSEPHFLPLLLIVAFVSGFGAVYAWLKHAVSANFVGVAIAVALIPFVSFYGILIGTFQWLKLVELSLIFVPNLMIIILGAVLAFRLFDLQVNAEDVNMELSEAEQNKTA